MSLSAHRGYYACMVTWEEGHPGESSFSAWSVLSWWFFGGMALVAGSQNVAVEVFNV